MRIGKFFKRLTVFVLCGLFAIFGLSFAENGEFSYALTPSDSVLVDELWNGKAFDSTNLTTLLKYISGKDSTSLTNFAGKKTQSSTINSFAVLGKQAGQDVVVTLGGLQWTVVYLSKDKNGRDILTLWLTDASQLDAKCTWSDGKNKGTASDESPENMYGTSYVRAVGLNNGGKYMSDDHVVEVEQNKDHKLAPFTINKNGIDLSDFIVTPQYVFWQEKGQSTYDIIGWTHNASNENWSKNISNVDYYTNEDRQNFNYSKKANSDLWKNDKLWIPSLSEVGYQDGQGIWGATNSQRLGDEYTWLRTSAWENSQQAVVLYKSGKEGCGSALRDVSEANNIRPALHLNLTSAIRSARGLDPFNFNTFPFWTLYVGGGVILLVGIGLTIFFVKKKSKQSKK